MKHTLKGIAERTEQGGFEVYLDGNYLSPKRSQKFYNHSPDGFSWGYCGSGCAQLALAICLELMSEDKAIARYQAFKRDFIAGLPQNQGFEAEFELGIEIQEGGLEV
jgi:hypothetical protein